LDTTENTFHCDVDNSTDEKGNKLVTVQCHGRLVNQTASELREIVKPLIPQGGTITIDLAAVQQNSKSRKSGVNTVEIALSNIEKANLVPEI